MTRLKFLIFGLMSALALGIALAAVNTATAQEVESDWTPPENLSRSGGASRPVSVVDSDGVIHLVWTDELSGYLYARYDGEAWSAPELLNLPFDYDETLAFTFLSDGEDRIVAAWIENDNDLYVSSVPNDSFSNRFRWRLPLRLAINTIAVETSLDPLGILHLFFITAEEEPTPPSGVYHMRSSNRGNSWTRETLLYESTYFRSLSMDMAHLSVVTGIDGEQVWLEVAWDNRARERVFATRSVDGGETWEMSEEVAGPVEDPDDASTFNITLATNGTQLLRLWQVGVAGEKCNQFFQASNDAGASWTEPEILLAAQSGCPDYLHFMPLDPGLTVMLFRNREMPYLMAWNGSAWGQPILQETLAELKDPETLNQVILGCLESHPVGDRIYVIGCDDNFGGDVWASHRTLDPNIDWFPPEPIWSPPFTVSSTTADQQSPSLIMDSQGRAHLFWTQAISEDGENPKTGIFYARRESGSWSTARIVIQSPEGNADNPAVGVDKENRLHVVWTEGLAGNLYYSWANPALAVTASEWQAPIQLPVPRPLVSAPDIFIDTENRIFVVYAVQLNEGRGIYLIKSTDGGLTWSEPKLVLDVEAVGWEMVDQPHITSTDGRNLHVFLTRRTLPGGEGALALYYARSADQGTSWLRPDEVVSQPVLWSELRQTNQQVLHRIWEQRVLDRVAFRHQISLDLGTGWTEAESVSGLEDLGTTALTSDGLGQLHLVHTTIDAETQNLLLHWTWNGEAWLAQESFVFDTEVLQNVDLLAAAVSPGGNFVVIMGGQRAAAEGDALENAMIFVNRDLDLPDVEPTPFPSPTPAATETPAPTEVPPPSPTPTVDLSSVGGAGDGPPGILSQLDIWAGPVIGIAAAGLIVILVFLLGVRQIRS